MTKRKQPKARQGELVTLPPKRLRDAAGGIIDVPARKVWMSAEMAVNYRLTAELIGALKTGNNLSMADFERYATNPPMTGSRLLNIILALHNLKADEWAKVKHWARIMGAKGGKAPRRDPYAHKKADVLKAWEGRTNRMEGALPWAKRMHAQRAITIRPRTAAEWIREAHPKKKRNG